MICSCVSLAIRAPRRGFDAESAGHAGRSVNGRCAKLGVPRLREWAVLLQAASRSGPPPRTCSLTRARPARYTYPWAFSSRVEVTCSSAHSSLSTPSGECHSAPGLSRRIRSPPAADAWPRVRWSSPKCWWSGLEGALAPDRGTTAQDVGGRRPARVDNWRATASRRCSKRWAIQAGSATSSSLHRLRGLRSPWPASSVAGSGSWTGPPVPGIVPPAMANGPPCRVRGPGGRGRPGPGRGHVGPGVLEVYVT
jgi:hypothetical protein